MKENLSRFWEVDNGDLPSPDAKENGPDVWMREMFCTKDAMRGYITGTGKYMGYTVPLRYYPNGEYDKKRFIERLFRDRLEGPVQYYHSQANNTMLEGEQALCDKAGKEGDQRKIEVPLLNIGQSGDWVCRTDLMKDAQKEILVPDLEEKVVQGGHWTLYEKPDEIAYTICEWLTRGFPCKGVIFVGRLVVRFNKMDKNDCRPWFHTSGVDT